MKRMTTVLLTALLLLTALSSHPGLIRANDAYRDQVAVLMYHHIADDNTSSSTITTALFREQLAYLQERGYRFISLAEFKAFLSGASVPGKAVFVTFDDGYDSYYRLGVPIMKELGVPSINFIITSHLRQKQTSGIPTLTKAAIQKMLAETPLALVGSHSDNLHNEANNGKGKPLLVARLAKDGRTETDAEYEARIRNDLNASHSLLSELSPNSADAIAYPYGVYDREALRLVRESGFRYGFTIAPGMTTRSSDPLKLPRINAGNPEVSPAELDKMIQSRVRFVGPLR
ncbi:polysaccharide deacetylase family protein [Gorillibacterium sp. sgz500922]|uniref:polysaccharide deacetylase family protein n=1 Tax=Gorillibacterium sp. sgz500922 TaxID=3446694 RepID=UPI003F681CA1